MMRGIDFTGRAARSWQIATALSLALLCSMVTTSLQAQTKDIFIDDGSVSKIEMSPGRTLTVRTDRPFADILIGNTAVIDVFPLTDNSLYIQSKALGVTNVTLYSVDKQLLEVIDVRVRVNFSDVEKAIRRAVPSARVSVSNVNNQIRVTGEVRDSVEKQRVLQIASQFTAGEVIDAVNVHAAQQVELDVRILEVERNSGRSLGADLTGTRSNNEVAFQTSGAQVSASSGTPFGTLVGELLQIGGFEVDILINALEAKGLARRLANPKLTTTSGVEANFVVGGEVPITQSSIDANGNSVAGTSYREYGVRLNFLPVVLDDELIRLEIRPEVSDIDPSLSVNGQPAFISRKAETTVSLRNGQSFAIAGLLQVNNARSTDQVPWLGDIPILGTLFSSRRFTKRETDLVILVTPRLVSPRGPDQPLVSPLDETRSSNDIELFLLGLLEVDRDLLKRYRDGAGVDGPYGHIIDLEFSDGVIQKK